MTSVLMKRGNLDPETRIEMMRRHNREDGHLQATDMGLGQILAHGLRRTHPAHTLIADFWPSGV